MPPPGSIWANGRGVSRSGPAVSVQWIVRSAAPTRTGTRAILRVLHMVTICHLSSDCRGPHRDGLDSERMQSGCHDADATRRPWFTWTSMRSSSPAASGGDHRLRLHRGALEGGNV